MDHLTEQDAGLLEQAATILEEHAEEQRTRGNDSAAEGAACSAHAIRRLAPAILRAGASPAAVAPQGVKFFSASNEGLDEHDTAEAAQNEAQSIIDMYREEAADGWPEDVDSVCWGVILGKAVERPVQNAPHMKGIMGSDMEPVDYVLEPVAAPALEAPAAPSEDLALVLAALEHGHPRARHSEVLAAARRLAAAPQAPAAPAVDAGDAKGEREFWAVLAPCGEGVIFKHEKDARWTLTGEGAGHGGFGVPTIGESFRDCYEDDELELVRVRVSPQAAAKGEHDE